MAAARSDKAKPYFSERGNYTGVFSNDKEATATCYCDRVQIVFPTEKDDGYVGAFICHCADCRKFTASMFASNFVVKESTIRYVRGQELLKTYGPQTRTIKREHEMANIFCSECGTLMFRRGSGFPGMAIARLGTVDDLNLVETKLRPAVEIFIENKVNWLPGAASDIVKSEGMDYYEPKRSKGSSL